MGYCEDSRVDCRGGFVGNADSDTCLAPVDVVVVGSGIAGLFLAVR